MEGYRTDWVKIACPVDRLSHTLFDKLRTQRPLECRMYFRSVNAEVLKMISERVEMNRRRRQAAKVIQKLRKEREHIAREYPHQPDSADLVREDRDSR